MCLLTFCDHFLLSIIDKNTHNTNKHYNSFYFILLDPPKYVMSIMFLNITKNEH